MKWDPSLLFVPKQPIDWDSEYMGERFEFVIEDTTLISFDFGYCCSVELNPESGKLPRKSVLR